MDKYFELEREAERLNRKIHRGRWSNDPQDHLDDEEVKRYKEELEKIERALSQFY